MVDWNKEVKVSDLFGRRKGEKPAPAEEPQDDVTPSLEPEIEAQLERAATVAPLPLDEPVVEEQTVELAAPPAPEVAAPAPEVPAPAVLTPAPPPPAPGVHAPVPASELEPELGVPEPAEEKTSFLKKEISFGRKSREPKAPKEKKERKPKRDRTAEKAERKAESDERKQQSKEPKEPKTRRTKRDGGSKRQKLIVGLKIGASQLAAARVVNNGHPELVQVARQELEQGIVVGGELREPDLLAEALKEFFRKNKLPRQGVRLGIANNRIGVRIFDISGIEDGKQLENAIRFRAQEALPIPLEDAVLDYQVLSEVVDAEGNHSRKILLVVAYRELIDRYVSACKKAGIKLAGIDLEAFALLRALGETGEESDQPSDAALVVVSIGHDRSTFAVSDGRVCEFTRVLDWGGANLNVALARALDIAPSEAEPIKERLSLTVEETPEGLTDDQANAARDAVRKQLQTFARELVSSLQFYQNQPGSLGIGEIVFTGGTAQLDGLAQELQQLIGVPVRIGDPLGRVKVGKRVKELSQPGSFAVAIGLGIED
ncbi:MAG: type IV pilus assembly protein PilM [Actinomycetota bacterium]|nr:type IV pilus assembly protein PilM [Actinomycetota bacterium]